MPRTPEQYEEIRNEKKQLIMDTALSLFANKGYASTSITQIAKNANISKGLMYNYYESKEELLHAIITKIKNEMLDLIDPNHDYVISDEEALAFFDMYFDLIKTRYEEMKYYFQLTFQAEVIQFLSEEFVKEQDNRYSRMFLTFFKKKSPDNYPLMILHLSAILKGLSMQYVFSPEHFDDEILDRYKNYLKKIFVLEPGNSGIPTD